MKTIILKSRSVGFTTTVPAVRILSLRKMKRLAKNFFSESPIMRMIMRCGKARMQMQAYRKIKMIRRPRAFRQDVW